MTDEAKIAQQRTHIQATDTPARHGGSSPLETIMRGIATGEIPVARGGSSRAVEAAGLPHKPFPADEARADQSDAHGVLTRPTIEGVPVGPWRDGQGRVVAPTPAQGLETASGDTAREAIAASHFDEWFAQVVAEDYNPVALEKQRPLLRFAFLAGWRLARGWVTLVRFGEAQP